MQNIDIEYRAVTEGSKYVELGRQPHEYFNSKHLFLYTARDNIFVLKWNPLAFLLHVSLLSLNPISS